MLHHHHRPASRSDKPQSCEAPTPPARTAHARCPPLASSRSTHTRARTPYTQHHPGPSSLSPVRSAPHSCAAQKLQSPHDGGTSQRQQRLIGRARTDGQAGRQLINGYATRGSPLLSHAGSSSSSSAFSFGFPCFSPAISRFLLSRAAILWGQHIAIHPLAWFGSWPLGTVSSSVSAKAVSSPPVSLSLCHFQLANRARFTPYHPSPTHCDFRFSFSRIFETIQLHLQSPGSLLCSKARGGTNLASQIPMASCA
jgi:hypothetical protein